MGGRGGKARTWAEKKECATVVVKQFGLALGTAGGPGGQQQRPPQGGGLAEYPRGHRPRLGGRMTWAQRAGLGSGGAGRRAVRGLAGRLARRHLALVRLEAGAEHVQLLSVQGHLLPPVARLRVAGQGGTRAGESAALGWQPGRAAGAAHSRPQPCCGGGAPAAQPSAPAQCCCCCLPGAARMHAPGAWGCAHAAPPVQTWRWRGTARQRTQWYLRAAGVM